MLTPNSVSFRSPFEVIKTNVNNFNVPPGGRMKLAAIAHARYKPQLLSPQHPIKRP